MIFKDDLTKIFGDRKWKSYEEEQLIKLDQEKIESDKLAKIKTPTAKEKKIKSSEKSLNDKNS